MAHFPATTTTDGVMSATDKAKLDGFGAAGDYIKKDGSVAYTGDQPMGGNKITGLADGSAASDAATKGQLDAAVAGLSWKDHVRCASTADIDLATGGLLTIDGIGPLSGDDRVLVKNQGTPAQNGVYLVKVGAWVRAADCDSAIEVESAAVFVDEGTQANRAYVQTADNVTLGVTALSWTQFFAGSTSDEVDTARWVGIGSITTATDLDGAWVAPRAGTITRIVLHRRLAGSGGSTIVDVNKSGTTVFTTPANRPTVTAGGGNNQVNAHTDMDVTSFAQGDYFTIDVDTAEGGGAKDLAVTMEVKYT